jgi:hypothetical protein
MDEIDDAQLKYLNNKSMTFLTGRKDYDNLEVPPWLTLREAQDLYDELKEMLHVELLQMNSNMHIGEEAREQEQIYIHYKMQDVLF